MFADISAAYLKLNIIKMKTAKEITKRSTLLATIRSEFPKSTAIDLENELFEMINKTLMLGAVGQSEQLRAFKQFLQSEYHLPVSNRMVDEFEQKQSS